ncbi:sigma factor-like helix-turn-helix DNA-binding protein [Amnibacterium setariae]|uniref:RNA polymerase sigma-70 region 4 domain-containing protein n=1 Tax=Amnibacterium setariae TaxID=2306585 RepID=A0A3A1U4E6_9MICO|nr:sigma factor-like helix-turn-helix DNA-binding protein [Amnibacterium setariae]RIX27844.1 hypothetical protein D1781_09935 [Amnibacterium setariae]
MTSAPHVFVFRVSSGGGEGDEHRYSCTADSSEEAHARAAALGYRPVELIEQKPLDGAAHFDKRLEEVPALGPQWRPLIDVLEVLMRRVVFGQHWTLRIYGARYGYDPRRSVGAQVTRESDGALSVEIIHMAPSYVGQADSAALGWLRGRGVEWPKGLGARRLFRQGWSERAIAVDLLEVLRTSFNVGEGDFFHFGEEVADEVDALERAGRGPRFSLNPKSDGPGELLQDPDAERGVSDPDPAPLFARLLESARIVRHWDELELAARLREGLWRPSEALIAHVEQEFGVPQYEYAEIDRLAAGELTGRMLRSAALALLHRDALESGYYEDLTTAFASSIGAVHPGDESRLSEVWGRRGHAIRAFLSIAAEMAHSESEGRGAATTAEDAELEEARVVALSALLGAGRRRVAAFDPSHGWEFGTPFTDALLATECADLVDEDPLLGEEHLGVLAKAWFAAGQDEADSGAAPAAVDETIRVEASRRDETAHAEFGETAPHDPRKPPEELVGFDEWRDLVAGRLPWATPALRGDADLAMDARSLQEFASLTADLAIERLTNWAVGDLFAVLPDAEWPEQDALPLRLRIRLKDGRTLDGTELRDLTVRRLTLLRGVGLQSVHDFLADLAERSLQVAPGSHEPGQDEGVAGDGEGPEVVGSSWIERLTLPEGVLQDFDTLLNWHQLIGRTSVPLLTRMAGAEPPAVRSARDRILALDVSSVVGGTVGFDGLAARLEEAIDQLGERAIAVLRQRLFADQPTRLEDIGVEFGVTRERIRQIESRARARLELLVTEDDALSSVIWTIREGLPLVQPLDGLLDRMPALKGRIDTTGRPVRIVLDRLDDAYEIDDGWVCRPTIDVARNETRDVLAGMADAHGLVELEAIRALSRGGALAGLDDGLQEWLGYCGLAVYEGRVLLRSRGLLDWAEALLAMDGRPCGADELLARMPIDRSVRSLKNQMGEDPRFVAVGRDRWALEEWGMPEYGSIRTQIGAAVDRAGGEVGLSELVDRLVAEHGVSARSVVSYASSGDFEVREGRVRRANERAIRIRKSPEMTKRLYRTADGWAYRIRVNADHLRGSGFSVPAALFSAVRRADERTVTFDSEAGAQVLAWNGQQPTSGSIRRFLQLLDLGADDEVLLHFHDDRRFAVERVRSVDTDLLLTAQLLVGASPSNAVETARRRIARAVGLDNVEWPEIVRQLDERDDLDVADLVRAALIDRGIDTGARSERDLES